MPAPLDLASRRFGRLQVLERAEAGARPAWRCRCDCGGIEVLRQYQLTERGVDACKACRQPDCAVCGTRVPLARGAKNTCSPGCEKAKIAANSAKHNARARAADPDHYRRKHAARRADPQQHARSQQRERERSVRRWDALKADPEAREAQLMRETLTPCPPSRL